MIQNKVEDIRCYFKQALHEKRFTTDKTGQKTIELIGASFLADEPSIFGKPNQKYIKAEIQWYMSQSTNINDIYSRDRKPPEAWQYSADANGEINSNYGYLIYNERFGNQYKQVRDEMMKNPYGRRGTMIYNRPSIWHEYNEGGKSDFICTNAVSYYLRDHKLHAVVQMRSNDVVFGYKNDYAWQRFVLENLAYDISLPQHDVGVGTITWQVQNLHVYERHFDLVE